MIARGVRRRTSLPTVHKQSSSLSHAKLRLNRLPSLQVPRATESQSALKIDVCIIIHSNWGHEHSIGCSDISFFTSSSQRLTVLKSKCEPFDEKQENLKLLTTGNMIKNENDEMWTHDWPLPGKLPLTLRFTLEGKKNLDFIRIWPPTDELLGMKDIDIYVNSIFVYRGQVGKSFGCDIPIKINPSKTLHSPLEEIYKPTANDAYGIIPMRRVKNLKISFPRKNGYDNFFSIQSISIYTENMKKLKPQVFNVELQNLVSEQKINSVFEEKKSYETELWTAKIEGGVPALSISFPIPHYISAIAISCCSARYFIISLDGDNVHFGKLPQYIANINIDVKPETVVYLTDPSDENRLTQDIFA